MSKADILRIPDYIGHIVEAIERIHRYIEDMSETDFLNDEKTQDAVIRNFEIIGEAARNIERYHSAFAATHSEVPWTLSTCYVTVLHTGILRVILNCSGKQFTRIYPNCELHSLIRQLIVL